MRSKYGYHNPFPKHLAREFIAAMPDNLPVTICPPGTGITGNARYRERIARKADESLLAPRKAPDTVKPERNVRVNLFSRGY